MMTDKIKESSCDLKRTKAITSRLSSLIEILLSYNKEFEDICSKLREIEGALQGPYDNSNLSREVSRPSEEKNLDDLPFYNYVDYLIEKLHIISSDYSSNLNECGSTVERVKNEL